MPNEYTTNGESFAIQIGGGLVALIDAEDFFVFEGPIWHAEHRPHSVYVKRQENRDGRLVSVYLHRLIMGEPENVLVDHIDCNGLNNRRNNLRLACPSKSAMNRRMRKDNTTGYKGVYRQNNKWVAKIGARGRQYFLGYFPCAESAYAAVTEKRRELHGDFRRDL
jgi:hypothetical protein